MSITFCNVTCRSPVYFSSCITSFEDRFCYKLSPSKELSSVEIHLLTISWTSLVVNLLKINILHFELNSIYRYVFSKLLNSPYAILLCHLFPSLNSFVSKYFLSSNTFSTFSITIAFYLYWCSHSLINVLILNLWEPCIIFSFIQIILKFLFFKSWIIYCILFWMFKGIFLFRTRFSSFWFSFYRDLTITWSSSLF